MAEPVESVGGLVSGDVVAGAVAEFAGEVAGADMPVETELCVIGGTEGAVWVPSVGSVLDTAMCAAIGTLEVASV